MTENEAKQIVCDQFLGGDVSYPLEPSTDLLSEGICDSLGLVGLASTLEQHVTGLRVLDQEVSRENLGSIERIIAFVSSKTGGK